MKFNKCAGALYLRDNVRSQLKEERFKRIYSKDTKDELVDVFKPEGIRFMSLMKKLRWKVGSVEVNYMTQEIHILPYEKKAHVTH